LRPEPEVPIHVDEPGPPQDAEEDAEEEAEEEQNGGSAVPEVSTEPLEPELLTLSNVPPAKVLATLHLDLVKERNKAIEAPKPLPSAPFFLPTAHEGVTPRFSAPLGEEEGAEEKETTNASRPSFLETLQAEKEKGGAQGISMPFQAFLRKGLFDKALSFLKEQTPSGVHLAIEELGPMASGDERELKAALEFFIYHLGRTHFADEVQAYLSLFLQAHGDEITASEELKALSARLGQVQEKLWASLSTQTQKSRCFLGMLTQTQSQW